MSNRVTSMNNAVSTGVMLNAYPDSIGETLSDIVGMLKRPELKDVFSLFYILPTFFNSDLDRGFSIIDYNLNDELVSREDLDELGKLDIRLKFDLVLNHLSVGSPQFQDMLEYGDASQYKDFFIDWNEFWRSCGEMGGEGTIKPREAFLDKLFMRKPGLPVLKVRFPDGSDRPYWNTFYQEVNYQEIETADLSDIAGLSPTQVDEIVGIVNKAIRAKMTISDIDLGGLSGYREEVLAVVERRRAYLGQMDLNARAEGVWRFYDETLRKLRDYGASLVRLDAFAYLHKQAGEVNFFNKPGTWEYLDRLKGMAEKYNLVLLPEIHSEYGRGLHAEVAGKGFPVYDFFFPGLVIDALDRGINTNLLRWIGEVTAGKIETVNMLGCHDGIPVLDLKGAEDWVGLLPDLEIDAVVEKIMSRGGRVKNLYGVDGKKIAYYQVNATFFSALGEDEQKLRLARAIQMFMPGIPQVWYLDLFAGKNDYAAADKGGTGGHKEINRTTLTIADVEQGLKREVVQDQLQLMRLRNTSLAFSGELEVTDTGVHVLQLAWRNGACMATLQADLRTCDFCVSHRNAGGEVTHLSFGLAPSC